jgi:alkanesulfonate monooxygenase SsuD/methylene tetrahydromethanopterin reductase-like flavin-dependent oxidoreductase (luciferase family)
MQFSVLIETMPQAPALAKLAEENGFTGIFMIDTHVGWREVVPYLTLCAHETKRLRIGTLVTNPVTRHPTVVASYFATLQEISNGRMVCGIAKGDSATRVMGERQATMKEFRESIDLIKRMMNGEEVLYTPKHPDRSAWLKQAGGKPLKIQFHWYKPPAKLPVYIGGYGPKTLHFAGEVADGVVIQAPHPDSMRWSLGHAHAGARSVGRDPATLKTVVSGPIVINENLKQALQDQRWFVQAVWNHSAHLLEHYKREELPESLVLGLPKDFRSDYSEHVRRDAEELSQVPERAVDLLTVTGPASRCVERLQEVRAGGAKEFIHYALAMPLSEIEASIRRIGKEIIPRFN